MQEPRKRLPEKYWLEGPQSANRICDLVLTMSCGKETAQKETKVKSASCKQVTHKTM
jgi:hypothetical protein